MELGTLDGDIIGKREWWHMILIKGYRTIVNDEMIKI